MDIFNEHGQQPTLSQDYKTKLTTIDPSGSVAQRKDLKGSIACEQVKLILWDTAGQERFRQITRMYYRDIHAAILCFDITADDSFQACDFWLKDLKQNAPADFQLILCGTKGDLQEIREVERFDAEAFA